MCIFPPCRIHFEAKVVWQCKWPLRPCTIVWYYSYNLIMPLFTRFFVPDFVTELLDDAFQLGETELLTGIPDLLFILWAVDTKFWRPLTATAVAKDRFCTELITMSISSSASKIKELFWPLTSHASLLCLIMNLHFTKGNMKPNSFVVLWSTQAL